MLRTEEPVAFVFWGGDVYKPINRCIINIEYALVSENGLDADMYCTRASTRREGADRGTK